jgi:hypothetical protein
MWYSAEPKCIFQKLHAPTTIALTCEVGFFPEAFMTKNTVLPRKPKSDHEFSALLEIYKEHCAHGRHLETQRSAVASMFLAASGVLLSVAGALDFKLASLPLAVCVIGMAYFAKQFISVYAEKWDETCERRRYYREQMEELSGAERGNFVKSSRRLRRYWEWTFNAILVIGTVITFLILVRGYATNNLCTSDTSGAIQMLKPFADCPSQPRLSAPDAA